MNILMCLTPKYEVAYLESNNSIRQAAEKMYRHNFTVIPVLDEEGKYIRSVSEGDIFRYMFENHLNFEMLEHTNVLVLGMERDIQAIKIDKNMEDLIDMSVNQNFVPVLDDEDKFIGIVTRKKIIEHLKETRNVK